MSWKAISPVLVAVFCPACVGADQTSRIERGGDESALSATYAPEDTGDASEELTWSTEEDTAPEEACTEEDTPERTGEAAQAEEGYPEARSPWGDGAPDGHTYSGGPPGGGGRGHDYPGAKKPIGAGGSYPRTVKELRRAEERRQRRALANKTRAEIQGSFAEHRSEARSGKRVGGGGSVDHRACVWTCGRVISEACQGIQALCAASPIIVLSAHVTISCGAAIFAACITGRLASAAVCEAVVCAGVQ